MKSDLLSQINNPNFIHNLKQWKETVLPMVNSTHKATETKISQARPIVEVCEQSKYTQESEKKERENGLGFLTAYGLGIVKEFTIRALRLLSSLKHTETLAAEARRYVFDHCFVEQFCDTNSIPMKFKGEAICLSRGRGAFRRALETFQTQVKKKEIIPLAFISSRRRLHTTIFSYAIILENKGIRYVHRRSRRQ
ncbi:hypothetical protein BDF14DRAFT_915925 [Spinellus fusiger]|nr:hypothetical protein BDF14DRAFT_915925 [Spinellus fusiger]